MCEERFCLLERCLGFPWWRLEVKRDWALTVGKKDDGSPTENSHCQPYHEKMMNNVDIAGCTGHYNDMYNSSIPRRGQLQQR